MADKGEKKASGAPRKAAPNPAPVKREPTWDVPTWVSMSNARLGVPAFVVAGALHMYRGGGAKLTEAQVRRHIKDFLGQSL